MTIAAYEDCAACKQKSRNAHTKPEKTYALQINKLLFTFNGELPLCWIQHL